jgi:transposase
MIMRSATESRSYEGRRGRPRCDDRMILNGIVWKFRSGVAWRDVPERYGRWATLHTRFRRWARDGTFARMLQKAQARADAEGPAAVDRLHHRPCSSARRRGPEKGATCSGTVAWRADEQDSFGLRRRRPPALVRHHRREHQRLHAVHRRHGGDPRSPHRPRTATGATRTPHRRQRLQLEGHPCVAAAPRIAHTIPERADQIRNRSRRGSCGGRPPTFDKQLHKRRNVVEGGLHP